MEAGCMRKITTATITDRLGGPPDAWTFFGQCFHAGDQSGLKCAILQQPSQYFFTLSPLMVVPDVDTLLSKQSLFSRLAIQNSTEG